MFDFNIKMSEKSEKVKILLNSENAENPKKIYIEKKIENTTFDEAEDNYILQAYSNYLRNPDDQDVQCQPIDPTYSDELAIQDLITLNDLLELPTEKSPMPENINEGHCSLETQNKSKDAQFALDDLSEASTNVTIILMELVRNIPSMSKMPKSIKRWRIATPSSWKKNRIKKLRAEGLPYITKKKVRNPKVPQPVDCSKCQFKCTVNILEEHRSVLCRKYWRLNYPEKKNFILSCIDVKKTKTALLERKRQTKRAFSTTCNFQLNDEKVKVCQKFFCKTLCVSQAVISNTVKNRDSTGTSSHVQDPRGRHEPPNKTPPDKILEVRQHIESFPTMSSHYVRKDTERKYLDSKLSINKMYKLYVAQCEEKSTEPVSEVTYRRIFGTDYNLGFFLPKKDQCLVCTRYEREKTEELREEYEQHLERKEICNNEKKKDKKRADTDENFVSVSFDLQAILQIPSGDVGLLYYTRKLTVYNLTVYESAEPNEAYCFTWSEINGKKGSSEIGSILLHYLLNCVPTNVTEVSMFSDTCGGQNRNKNFAAVLFWAVQKIKNLQFIEQKFLESGHSYMEADSMHSSIESAKKNTAVYSMTEWKNIFKRARSKKNYRKGKKKIMKQPYKVTEFKFSDFKDFKDLSGRLLPNTTINTEGSKVKWLKIKRIRFVKGETKIFYNYDMSETFAAIDTSMEMEPQTADHCYETRTKKRKTLCQSSPEPTIPVELKQLYDSPLPISAAKKKDLLNLCAKGVIPEEFHDWFRSLPDDSKARDVLPDATLSDDDDYICD